MRTRSLVASVLLTPVVLLACGSDDSSESTSADTAASEATDAPATDPPDTEPPATDAPATDPPATGPPATEPVETEPPVTQPPATDPATTEPAAGDVAVTLDEWLVEAPTELTAGETTFQIQNDGSFPHEFVVIAGDGYESLPLAPNGAVLEDDLPAGAIVDRTDRIQGGLAGELSVDLAPGNYVLLCNIVAGPTSHAGQGQTLDVTVG